MFALDHIHGDAPSLHPPLVRPCRWISTTQSYMQVTRLAAGNQSRWVITKRTTTSEEMMALSPFTSAYPCNPYLAFIPIPGKHHCTYFAPCVCTPNLVPVFIFPATHATLRMVCLVLGSPCIRRDKTRSLMSSRIPSAAIAVSTAPSTSSLTSASKGMACHSLTLARSIAACLRFTTHRGHIMPSEGSSLR